MKEVKMDINKKIKYLEQYIYIYTSQFYHYDRVYQRVVLVHINLLLTRLVDIYNDLYDTNIILNSDDSDDLPF